jgi:hypothetical protein
MTLSLYSVHATDSPGEYIIQKFDPDYRCESVYALSEATCMCPQGHKPTCRHRKMLAEFLRLEHIGDGWFMEWETRRWRKPVNDINSNPEGEVKRPSAGEESAEPSPSPPPPPEGHHSTQAAGAAPVSPVGTGAIVKRRRIP